MNTESMLTKFYLVFIKGNTLKENYHHLKIFLNDKLVLKEDFKDRHDLYSGIVYKDLFLELMPGENTITVQYDNDLNLGLLKLANIQFIGNMFSKKLGNHVATHLDSHIEQECVVKVLEKTERNTNLIPSRGQLFYKFESPFFYWALKNRLYLNLRQG